MSYELHHLMDTGYEWPDPSEIKALMHQVHRELPPPSERPSTQTPPNSTGKAET